MGPHLAVLLALGALSEADAVSSALSRSRELVAARLNVEAAEVDKVAARVWPNPLFSYSAGNLVLPPGNEQQVGLNPAFFSQPVHTVGLSQQLDIWFKHSKRVETAERGTEAAQLWVEAAAREVVHAVRGAFAEALHAQEERELAEQARARYDETVRLSAAKYKVGETAKTDFKKIELERLRYVQAEHEAQLALELAREKLAQALVLAPGALPDALEPTVPKPNDDGLEALTQKALDQRPDLRAQRKLIDRAEAALAAQHREFLPDLSIGLSYTRDYFTISGDNPQALAFSVGLPLPVFDRNQAGIGHAAVDLRTAENERDRLELLVRHDVADAARRIAGAKTVYALLNDEVAPRASEALAVAEKSYQAGATSLLELLEAQRTYVDVRRDLAGALFNLRQASIDVTYAVGGSP